MFHFQTLIVFLISVLLLNQVLMLPLVEHSSASKNASFRIVKCRLGSPYRFADTNGMRTLWKDGIIPYKIQPKLESHRCLIESAMMHIMLQSCVLFRAEQYQDPPEGFLFRKGGVLTVERKGEKKQCSGKKGYVRQIKGGVLKLNADHCFNFGVILHALMHVLGLSHENQQSDREQNLQINYENLRNISSIRHYNKKNVSGKKILTEFDTDSITMYGPVDGSKNKTIESKVPGTQVVSIEDMLALSPLDVKAVNELYKCPSVDENACMKFELLYSYISDCSIEARKYISLPLKKKFIDQCR